MQSNKFIPLHTFIINCHYMELKKIISNSLKVTLSKILCKWEQDSAVSWQ